MRGETLLANQPSQPATPESRSTPKRVGLLAILPQLRGPLTLTIFCGLVLAVFTLLQMFFLSDVIARVFLQKTPLAQLTPLLLLLLAAIVGHALLAWAREVSAQWGAVRAKAALRQRVFRHLLLLGPAYLQQERTGELAATLSEGVERLDAYISRYLPQIVLSVLVPCLILAVVFPLDWVSGLLLLLTAPIIPLLMILVGSYAEKQTQKQWKALSLMSAHFLDVVQGLTTLKLFGRSQVEQGRVARISDAFREKTMKTLRLAFLSGATLEFMATMAIGLVAVALGIRLIDRGLSFQTGFFILLLAPEFYRPLRDLGTHRHTGLEGRASAQRMLEILATPLPVQDQATLEVSKHPTGALEIAFHQVAYTYPGNKQATLDALECTLSVHTCTALVGRSGAGKTTIARLLMRYMECSQGMITVNDLPLNELPVELWREYVALVPQRPYLFCESIRENIRMARPSASEEEIINAAEQAGALDFIRQLPAGFDTLVGEQGARLSAGQAQRIAIARAFLKDAPLLILDEPTSSLDPESENAMRQSLERLVQQRTVLVIAHRLNTIASASQVLVLEQGKLTCAGTPADWLRSMEAEGFSFAGSQTEEAFL